MVNLGCDKMNSHWQIDLYNRLNNATDMQDVLDTTLKIVKNWGFDYCGFRSKLPMPLAKHRFSALSSNEDKISKKAENGEYDNSPLRKHCSQSIEPTFWGGTSDEPLFQQAPEMWEEYHGSGHLGGWAQSIIEAGNMYSMFLVDSPFILTKKHFEYVDFKLQWVATAVLARMNQIKLRPVVQLSEREKEVLRWTGDGKTADEIAQILTLSNSTINFHLRKAMYKLNASNKTSAVVKAIYLNLLH